MKEKPIKLDSNKIETANLVLQSLASDTRIEKRKGGYFIVWKQWNTSKEVAKKWACRQGQDFYPIWHDQWAHGGTACTALSQLIRWLQNKPVFPICTWQYWTSKTVNLLPEASIALLQTAGYPEYVNCVLCNQQIKKDIDWWSLKKISGPCCGWNSGCKQKIRNKEKP